MGKFARPARAAAGAACLAAALAIAAAPALAQRAGRLPGAPRGGGGGGGGGAPPTGSESVSRPQEVWPRLDTGAFLCASLDDLRRHAVEMSDPGGASGPRAACRLVQKMTPITIVSRAGPGATEVRLSGAAGPTGWTNAYLPDKGPAAGRSAAAR